MAAGDSGAGMGTFTLSDEEERLFRGVEHGDSVEFEAGEKIDADVLRHIIIGLPLVKDRGTVRAVAAALTGNPLREIRCRVTGVGISIKGGVIKGRLRLDAAIGDQGGPVFPLEFDGTCFEGGFSGAHAKFSRLSFRNCSFRDVPEDDPPPEGKAPGRAGDSAKAAPPVPTIDLTDASVDGDLDMRGVGPARASDLLWIRAPGIRVDGKIDLCCCTLRSPDPQEHRLVSDEAADALNLTLAEIRGDLQFLNGASALGRLKLRGAQIDGDVWMSGATLKGHASEEEALFLQGARIAGFLMLDAGADRPGPKARFSPFDCDGNLNLTAAEIGLGLDLDGAIIRGAIHAPDLTVDDDAHLWAEVYGKVDLENATIKGSLSLAALKITDPNGALSLKDVTAGRALRLKWAPRTDEQGAGSNPSGRQRFEMAGEVDLQGATCTMLDDSGGRDWGRDVAILMTHFVYSRASWGPDLQRPAPSPKAPGKQALGPRLRAWRRAAGEKYRSARESVWKKIKRGAAERLPVWFTDWRGWTDGLRLGDHWTPWEIRRNWIFQQFDAALIEQLPSPARYRINSSEYRPQPFEQAIKVARSEGREDFAIHFEILKRNIEWRLFSRRNWEWFLFLGLFAALAWLAFYRANLTAEIVMAAIAIGAVLTFISPLCHRIMDWLFGHLRRPVRAIATLVVAFLLGWAGVHAANERGMMVIDVDPVATQVGESPEVMVIGSPREADVRNLASNVHCGDRVSEALYALDVLVPLIDLREESRCEVGQALPDKGYVRGGLMGVLESVASGPTTFWAVLKALYAIAGWFIVSLSILTFAQITRSRGESS